MTIQKISNYFDAFVRWLVLSSADPQKASLMVKGILVAIATYGGFALGFFHMSIPSDSIDTFIGATTDATQLSLTAISILAAAWSAWATVWGALRKLLVALKAAYDTRTQ